MGQEEYRNVAPRKQCILPTDAQIRKKLRHSERHIFRVCSNFGTFRILLHFWLLGCRLTTSDHCNLGIMAKSTSGSDDESLGNSFVQRFDNDERESDTMSCTGTHYSGTSYLQSSLGDRSGSADGPARPAYVDPVVAEKEQRAVKRSRMVVIAVLIISSAILATTMYLIVSRGEHETFQQQVSAV